MILETAENDQKRWLLETVAVSDNFSTLSERCVSAPPMDYLPNTKPPELRYRDSYSTLIVDYDALRCLIVLVKI